MDLFLFIPRTAPTVAGTSFLFFRSAVFLYLRKSTGGMCHWCKSSSQSACANFCDIFALFSTPRVRSHLRRDEKLISQNQRLQVQYRLRCGETPISARCWLFCARSEPCARAASLWQINHTPGARWWPSAWNCVFRADLFILLCAVILPVLGVTGLSQQQAVSSAGANFNALAKKKTSVPLTSFQSLFTKWFCARLKNSSEKELTERIVVTIDDVLKIQCEGQLQLSSSAFLLS